MPIDYSKWDNLEISSSSEDEDDAPQPRVTRLDTPSSVTFGGKGGTISATSNPASSLASKEIPESGPASSKSIPPSWTDHGGLLQATSNNVEEQNLYWSQDRYSVTVRLELGPGEKVQSVQVEGILPFADRWSAVGSTKPKLVCISGKAVLLEGELPHPVHLEEDDSGVDWSVENEQKHRFLVVTLRKAVPMQGLTVWWRRPLTQFPEADLATIRGENNSKQQCGASKDFLEAWEEAHKIFRENKQKRDRKPM